MSYEEISAELDQKFTELGQNFGRVRPQIGPELGVKFSKKNPDYMSILAFILIIYAFYTTPTGILFSLLGTLWFHNVPTDVY